MHLDTYGREVKEAYRVLTDVSFERRLYAFDPRLKLMFDQVSERWTILEKAYDNSGWNCILKAENKDGSPKPLGDWVFNSLYVKRHNYDVKARIGCDRWLDALKYEAEIQRKKEASNISDDNQAMLRDDVLQWRKAAKELQGFSASDAKAGYRKV